MKEFLAVLLPRIEPQAAFVIHSFDGKTNLLKKLPARLNGLARYHAGPVVVVVDRDQQDCHDLKRQLDEFVTKAGAGTLTQVRAGGRRSAMTVVSRIAVEELEAWYFGDEAAVRAAYPAVPSFAAKSVYRDPDAIGGGTWEAFSRLVSKVPVHRGGLAKIQAARDIAPHMNIEKNRSASFRVFRDGVREILTVGEK
ncbi:DUF4276 family protein [Tsukamurella soli]|uniref:DUF4276 family protein n=2 Tax=Tsukamurella soli TaxID=644556 RepID=A0ABP8J0U7_9ACTN